MKNSCIDFRKSLFYPQTMFPDLVIRHVLPKYVVMLRILQPRFIYITSKIFEKDTPMSKI